ncbi:hypothetical protein BT93_E2321 [Corymbia citriodora subsp. variegata]|nr:hypothetical protein BT93_E2321 [Corymbia citriodora subsp. variegata]
MTHFIAVKWYIISTPLKYQLGFMCKFNEKVHLSRPYHHFHHSNLLQVPPLELVVVVATQLIGLESFAKKKEKAM